MEYLKGYIYCKMGYIYIFSEDIFLLSEKYYHACVIQTHIYYIKYSK